MSKGQKQALLIAAGVAVAAFILYRISRQRPAGQYYVGEPTAEPYPGGGFGGGGAGSYNASSGVVPAAPAPAAPTAGWSLSGPSTTPGETWAQTLERLRQAFAGPPQPIPGYGQPSGPLDPGLVASLQIGPQFQGLAPPPPAVTDPGSSSSASLSVNSASGHPAYQPDAGVYHGSVNGGSHL